MNALRIANKKGFILILAYSVIAALLVLISAIIQRSIGESNLARRNSAYTETFYLAEAGLAQGAFDLAFMAANPPGNVPSVRLNIAVNTPNANAVVTYSWTDLTGAANPDQTIIDPQTGTTFFIRYYQISATAGHNQFADIYRQATVVTLNQIIARRKTYAFQHAVFYNDDLELLPGRPMNFSGKIHSNHDIYIASDGSTLTIKRDTGNYGYLYSAGSIYNKRKDKAGSDSGSVSIQVAGAVGYELMKKAGEASPLDCLRSDWTDGSQNRWAGAVKSSVHGITSLAVPVVGSTQPTGYYAQNCGLKIVNTTAYDASGSPVSLPSDTVTQNTFYDSRAGKTVTVTDIDMAKLNTSGSFPANGLLYVTRTDATTSQPNGVRLKNGAELSSALTVVSNDPVYVQGNYNKTNKKPAAVIGDALNILSINWNDQDNQGHNNHAAGLTEVNAAFIAGIKTTVSGNYNGGLENYPRLLENWSNISLKIRGSFVELWNSQIAQGNWGSASYTPPNRDWDYDTSFNNPNSLPPFTPCAVEIQKVAWWKS